MSRPLPLSLSDAYLKTSRAKVHLDALHGELQKFRDSKPYSFVPEDDLEHGMYRLHLEFRDVPDPIWLIAGDLFYCLRASLDQLVWTLAKLSLPYPEGTQFPILSIDNSKNRKRFKSQTHGVPTSAVHIIESLQPYHGRDIGAVRSHLLWQLNELCIIDKHRRIPIHGQATFFHFPEFPRRYTHLIDFDHDNDMVSVPAHLKGYMTLHPETPMDVVFGDVAKGLACNIVAIERIYNFVTNDVIPRFARFLQQQV